MQGWSHTIATSDKIRYLNHLLHAGFDTLDFGSFVSPKAIPQMADTAEVLDSLDLSNSKTRLLAIVANLRGAETALEKEAVSFLGFPFSVSDTFQQRNTGISREAGFSLALDIHRRSEQAGKQAVIYLSMAFGNPYGEAWNREMVGEWAKRFADEGVPVISLADTVGIATPDDVKSILEAVLSSCPNTEIGVHLHCRPDQWREKLDAAWAAGCRRFDSAVNGIGGCPMAGDALVGNLNTRNLLAFLLEKEGEEKINTAVFEEAERMAQRLFI